SPPHATVTPRSPAASRVTDGTDRPAPFSGERNRGRTRWVRPRCAAALPRRIPAQAVTVALSAPARTSSPTVDASWVSASASSAGVDSANRWPIVAKCRCAGSTTSPPATPTTLTVSPCAHFAAFGLIDALTTATGLPLIGPRPYGREAQSRAFFNTAGT